MLFFFDTSREMIHLISCIFHFLHRDLRNCDSNQHDVFHKTSQSMRATNCVRTATSRRPLRHKMQEYFLVRWGTRTAHPATSVLELELLRMPCGWHKLRILSWGRPHWAQGINKKPPPLCFLLLYFFLFPYTSWARMVRLHHAHTATGGRYRPTSSIAARSSVRRSVTLHIAARSSNMNHLWN